MQKLLRLAAMAALSVGLAAGVATTGVTHAQTGTIDTTGPESTNTITFDETNTVNVTNENTGSDVINNNGQNAISGAAMVDSNTTGGNADTGNSANSSNHKVRAYVSNASATDLALAAAATGEADEASISNTGPSSTNTVDFIGNNSVTVLNDNDVDVTNNNDQTAVTGSADVVNNTTGGDANTGDATNTSVTDTSIEFHN